MPRKLQAAKPAPRKTHPPYDRMIAQAHSELIRKHRGGYTSSTLYFNLLKKYATIHRPSVTQALHRLEKKGHAEREGAHWKLSAKGRRAAKGPAKKRKRTKKAQEGGVAKKVVRRKIVKKEKEAGAAKPKAKKAKKVVEKEAKPAPAKREKKEGAKGRGRSASPKGGRASKAEAAPRAPKKVARQKTAALADDSNPDPADPRAQKAKVSYDNLAGVEYKWQYDDHGWRDYDKKASSVVEGHWVEFQADPHSFDVRAVRSGDWEYQVDFKSMTQTNVVHPSHTVRKLRRVIA